jgi:hypothetical protein
VRYINGKKVDPCTLVFAWPFEYFA